MTATMTFAGLDVHATQTHGAALDPRTGELSRRRIARPPEAALGWLEELEPDLLAVYEAGPTGFALAREARQRGIDLRVAAPGLIPRGPTRPGEDRPPRRGAPGSLARRSRASLLLPADDRAAALPRSGAGA